MAYAKDKGNILEDAVELIEKTIIQLNPSFEKSTQTIERNKIIVVEGVKHEIDIYVTIDPGSGYESHFIFECKNRIEKADKNDIIVFEKKVDDVQAQKGFFIAKHFTEDAVKESLRNKRIVLLTVNDTFELLEEFATHTVMYTRCVLAQYDLHTKNKQPLKDIVSIKVDNKDVSLLELRAYLQMEAISNKLKTIDINLLTIGKHNYSNIFNHKGNVIINGIEIESSEIVVNFNLHIFKPPVISKFNVVSRGISIAYERVKLPNGEEIQFSIAGVPNLIQP